MPISSDTLQNIAALVMSAIGLYTALQTRKKIVAEAAEHISNAARNVVEMSTDEMKHLRATDVLHEEYINYLLEGTYRLITQVKSMNGEPVFYPKPMSMYNKKLPE